MTHLIHDWQKASVFRVFDSVPNTAILYFKILNQTTARQHWAPSVHKAKQNCIWFSIICSTNIPWAVNILLAKCPRFEWWYFDNQYRIYSIFFAALILTAVIIKLAGVCNAPTTQFFGFVSYHSTDYGLQWITQIRSVSVDLFGLSSDRVLGRGSASFSLYKGRQEGYCATSNSPKGGVAQFSGPNKHKNKFAVIGTQRLRMKLRPLRYE